MNETLKLPRKTHEDYGLHKAVTPVRGSESDISRQRFLVDLLLGRSAGRSNDSPRPTISPAKEKAIAPTDLREPKINVLNAGSTQKVNFFDSEKNKVNFPGSEKLSQLEKNKAEKPL